MRATYPLAALLFLMSDAAVFARDASDRGLGVEMSRDRAGNRNELLNEQQTGQQPKKAKPKKIDNLNPPPEDAPPKFYIK
jgi:hypothetical protein